MWGNHISILYYIKKKEKEELIGPIEYDGVQYPSITACCHEYGVSPYTATSYIRKHECKVNDALKICIMNKQKRENYFFVYDGSSYTSLADCCKKLGVNKASVVSRKYRLGCSYDEAIDHFLNNKNTEV